MRENQVHMRIRVGEAFDYGGVFTYMSVDLSLSAYAFYAHWFIAVKGDLTNDIPQMVGTCAQTKSD